MSINFRLEYRESTYIIFILRTLLMCTWTLSTSSFWRVEVAPAQTVTTNFLSHAITSIQALNHHNVPSDLNFALQIVRRWASLINWLIEQNSVLGCELVLSDYTIQQHNLITHDTLVPLEWLRFMSHLSFHTILYNI